MVKAKELMDYLCNELEFRFFSGVPCSELQLLYNEMDPNKMHYIPAVTETIAIGIASGVWISNVRSCVMMDSKKINSIKPILDNINIRLEIPVLFIFGGDCKSDYLNMSSLHKNYKKQLDDITNYMNTKKLPSGIFIKEGFLS
jgi:sulfopyruvate decarboxylase TPP-binding subunit